MRTYLRAAFKGPKCSPGHPDPILDGISSLGPPHNFSTEHNKRVTVSVVRSCGTAVFWARSRLATRLFVHKTLAPLFVASSGFVRPTSAVQKPRSSFRETPSRDTPVCRVAPSLQERNVFGLATRVSNVVARCC